MATLPNTTLTQELRIFFDNMPLPCVKNIRYIGDCVYGKITDEILLKAEFKTLLSSNRYELIRLSAIRKNRGEIDHVDINLPMTNTPYGRISRKYLSKTDDGRIAWYSKPDQNEIGIICAQISDYVSFFQ